MLIRVPALVNPAMLLHHGRVNEKRRREVDVRDPLPGRILIPVDVSEFRRRAFRLGVRLASLNDAEVILLTVVDDRFPYPDIFSFHVPNEDYYKHIRERAAAILDQVIAEAPRDVRIRPMVSRGNPARVIVEVAEREGAELIIMTSHTTRGLEHMILGSVADKVLRSTPCPVLVIPIRDGGKKPSGTGAAGHE